MAQKLTPEILNAAIAGFEAQKNHIDSQIAEVRSMLDGGSTGPAVTPPERVPQRAVPNSAPTPAGAPNEATGALATGRPDAPTTVRGAEQAALSAATTPTATICGPT